MSRVHHPVPIWTIPSPNRTDTVNNRFHGVYNRPSGVDMMQTTFQDEPPESTALTAYDREHMVLYLRLIDSATDGADWREAVSILFGINPQCEPERARHVHDSHLARARWMTEQGYRQLVREGSH